MNDVFASAPREFRVAYQSFLGSVGNFGRFRGKGTARIGDGELRLSGKQSRPFWFSRNATVGVALARIGDVVRDGRKVSFALAPEPDPKPRKPVPNALWFGDEASAQAFAQALPAKLSEQAAEQVQFAARLASATRRPWLAQTLVAINVLVYLWFGLQGGGWMKSDSMRLIAAGSNFGPYTTDGQWWRLVSAAFLHGGLIHLAVNMVTLYDIGRLCERLYGSGRFFLLYFASALLGSAASVWWNPVVNSVGASGALFGVLGATFVYMLNKRNRVPVSVMKTHQASIGVFIVYGVVNGLASTGIDNACHIGGLAAGVICGLGLSRPMAGEAQVQSYWAKPAVALACVAIAIAGLLVQAPNTRPAYELEKSFLDDLNWFRTEETAMIAEARQIVVRANQPGASEAELKPQLEKLSRQWDDAHQRLASHQVAASSKLKTMQVQMIAFLDLRRRAYRALVAAFDGSDQADAKSREFARLMKEGDELIKVMLEQGKK